MLEEALTDGIVHCVHGGREGFGDIPPSREPRVQGFDRWVSGIALRSDKWITLFIDSAKASLLLTLKVNWRQNGVDI